MNEFALSTSWNVSRHKDAKAIIDEIRLAGFDSVELNFTLTAEMVDDISSMVKKGEVRVRSLHNYCPIPKGIRQNEASPDYYSLASLDEEERNKAAYFTKKTIDKAADLNAACVVLHCGKVAVSDRTRHLMMLYEENRKDSDEFSRIKEDMVLKRRENSKPHIERLLHSLDELNTFAQKKKIILGIENRCYFTEIPSFEEISLILERFKHSALSYWHDVGHACIFEELGFCTHKDFLQNYGLGMAGAHLHDVRGIHDHLAPGGGGVDFSVLKPYLNENVIKIIEAHKTENIDDVRYAREYLSRVLG